MPLNLSLLDKNMYLFRSVYCRSSSASIRYVPAIWPYNFYISLTSSFFFYFFFISSSLPVRLMWHCCVGLHHSSTRGLFCHLYKFCISWSQKFCSLSVLNCDAVMIGFWWVSEVYSEQGQLIPHIYTVAHLRYHSINTSRWLTFYLAAHTPFVQSWRCWYSEL